MYKAILFFECALNVGYINTINYLEIIKLYFYIIYNIKFMSVPVLPFTDNIRKCFKTPDCLLAERFHSTNSDANKNAIESVE